MTRQSARSTADLALLRGNLHELIDSWRKRAWHAERCNLRQIAADYRECADELNNVVRGGPRRR